MDSAFAQWQAVLVFAIPVLFAISLHEAAHGYVARFLGDPTAAQEGRVSINPLRHIDPLGTVVLPLFAYWLIAMPFGYAKPVPIDVERLGHPRRDTALVALAGPAANAAMGVLWALVGMACAHVPLLYQMAIAGVLANGAMFVFNMLPVPPLDGGEILMSLLPRRFARKMEAIRMPPARPKRTIRLLRRVLPHAVMARVVRMEVYDLCVFATFMLLMKFHVLDRFLNRAVYLVGKAFRAVAYPVFSLL